MSDLVTYQTRLEQLVQDTGNNLDESEAYTNVIRSAVEKYSSDRPNINHEVFTGDGSAYQFTFTNTDFDASFSALLSVEYPADQRPRQYLDQADFFLFEPTGELEIPDFTPGSGQTIRVRYTARHLLTDLDGAASTTIPVQHQDSIIYLACALALRQLAAKFIHEEETVPFEAELVERGDKYRRALEVARAYEKQYNDVIGVGGDSSGSANVVGASARVDWDLNNSLGRPYLTHSNRLR